MLANEASSSGLKLLVYEALKLIYASEGKEHSLLLALVLAHLPPVRLASAAATALQLLQLLQLLQGSRCKLLVYAPG
jgi:hypothetical protein